MEDKNTINFLKKENAELKSKLDEAVEVLEYYGDKNNWEDDTKEFLLLLFGRGDYAREALKKLRAPEVKK